MSDDITIGVTEIVNNIEVTAQPNDQIVDISVIDNADDVTLNITPTVIEINVNRGSSFAKWGTILGTLSDQTDLQNALDLKANLVGGKVPASELPSYVDDVIEVANYAALPATGETGKIYVTIDNNKIFRWTGSTYVEIIDSAAVWGAITGTLSSQTDLQNALNLKANDNAVVKLTGDQTISGVKTFSNPTTFNSSLNIASGAYSILYNPANSAYWQTYVDSSNVFNFGYNGNIVKASISNSGNFTANSFIKSGGTSSQFLKADGSVDSSTYALTSQLHDAVTLGTTGVLNGLSLSGQVLSLATASSTTRGALTAEDYSYFFGKQNALTNPVTGTGTTNYIPKFTGASAIGNSLIYDNGTNIGIGTTSPLSKLHIEGDNSSTTDETVLTLRGNGENGKRIDFRNAFGSLARITGTKLAGGASADEGILIFETAINSVLSEKMRITSGGNVGIGTTSPDSQLVVNGASNSRINMRAGDTRYGTLYADSGAFAVGSTISIPLILATNDTEKMRITSGGNVGIGTTSPLRKLTVTGSSGTTMIALENIGIDYYGIGMPSGSADMAFYSSASTERMRITSGGDIGIGTSTPLGPLTVAAKSNADTLFLIGRSADNATRIDFYNNARSARLYTIASGNGAIEHYADANVPMTFSTNGSERLRITSGGNLLIGTTTDAGQNLQVNGNAIIGTSSTTSQFRFYRATNVAGLEIQGGSGSASVGGSAYLRLGDVTNSRYWMQQINNSYNLAYWFFDGGSWSNPITFTNNGSASFAGSITASGGFFNSDMRLKDLIDYDYNVSDIKPITYLWKDGRDNKKHVGYSAQEVQKVMPDAVNEGTDGMLSVNYVEVLVAKIAELENRIKQLEK